MKRAIIKKAVVTEKAYASPNAVAVIVDKDATKDQIKADFIKLYGDKFEVEKVRTFKLPAKTGSKRRKIRRKEEKRAYIYLKKKEGFDFITFKK